MENGTINNMIRQLWMIWFILFGAVLLQPMQVAGFGSAAFMQDNTQEHTVSGVVTDSQTGEVLPGVNISVEGTTSGTSTDAEGQYSITVPSASSTLAFSFVGYQTQTVPIDGRESIDIELVPTAIIGEDIVVVGYGEQLKRDVTGSVSSVSGEQITEVPVTSAAEALQGRSAGVLVQKSGDNPGDGVEIRIRGRRSLTASNDPLFVIDGIPSGGLNDINQADIESMEVLKDASATAIYGSRGANGVVLITTKRGGDHPTKISYNGYFGISRQMGNPDMMNGAEFAEMKREANRAAGTYTGDEDVFTNIELESIQNNESYDYAGLAVENEGMQQSHQISISGGNQSTRFALSGNFFNEEGIIKGKNFNRTSFRVNLDHDISDRIRVGTSTLLSFIDRDVDASPFGGALITNPLGNPFNEDGTVDFRPTDDGLVSNPLADLVPGRLLDERENLRVFSNIFAEFDILENLEYRVNFGPDLGNWRRGVFQASETGARGGGPNFAQKQSAETFTYTLENILNYQQTVNDVHEFDITGLYSYQEQTRETSLTAVSDLPSDNVKFQNLALGATVEDVDSRLEEWSLMSGMGRINYQYNDKYLLTFTARADGSSRLAEGNRWGFFPSAAAGWVIVEEPFMANQDLFSSLKLRVSWGITGNTAIDPYGTRSLLSRTDYQFGDSPAFGFRPDQISNPNLEWEKSEQVNIGLDFGLWDDRVTGSVEVYQTNTSDMLLARQIPITSGFGSVLQNIGETRNRGIEFSISSNNIVSASGFNWSTDFNIFKNEEEIIDLFGDKEDDIGNEWFIGEPLSVFYDYEKIGIWQLDEAEEANSYGQQRPGQIRVKDQNGDGVINEQDRVILGSDIPDFSMGLANHFSYKGFNLSVFIFGSFGQTIFNNFRTGNSTLNGRINSLDVDYWTEDNPTNEQPQPDIERENPLYGTTRGYQDGSYLKVRNIKFGYNLPGSVTENLGILSLGLYVNAENPFIFSNLDDNLDPETNFGRLDNVDANNNGTTIDDAGGFVNSGLNTRLFTIGVDIDF